jgi:hypothetical protein
MALVRAIFLLTFVIAFLAWDRELSSSNVPSSTDPEAAIEAYYDSDRMLKIFGSLNSSLRNEPTTVINLATVVLFFHYVIMFYALVGFMQGRWSILLELVVGWVIGLIIKSLYDIAPSYRRIRYWEHLYYPLEFVSDDVEFAGHAYFVLMLFKHLKKEQEKRVNWTKAVLLGLHFVMLLVLLLSTFNTTTHAIVAAIAAAGFSAATSRAVSVAYTRVVVYIAERRLLRQARSMERVVNPPTVTHPADFETNALGALATTHQIPNISPEEEETILALGAVIKGTQGSGSHAPRNGSAAFFKEASPEERKRELSDDDFDQASSTSSLEEKEEACNEVNEEPAD